MILIPILISKPPGIIYAYSLMLLFSLYRSESWLPERYRTLKQFAELLNVRALLPAHRVPEARGLMPGTCWALACPTTVCSVRYVKSHPCPGGPGPELQLQVLFISVVLDRSSGSTCVHLKHRWKGGHYLPGEWWLDGSGRREIHFQWKCWSWDGCWSFTEFLYMIVAPHKASGATAPALARHQDR